VSERDEPATAETPCAEPPDSPARAQDPPDVYDLLLALAGRLDDDLLAWARELVAVGEEGQAVELVTAALAAERVMLPAAVRMAVVAAGRAAHTDLDVGRELAPPVPDDATVHRFAPAAASGDRVATVMAGLPARRLAGCTLYLTWRSTPAGAAPGPVPRAVVLVEAGPDRSADVLAYLLATELDRAAVPASVEVFTTGTTLPAYHRAALAAARRIEVGASVIAPAGVVVARTAAETAARATARPARVATPASVDPATPTGPAKPTVPDVPGAGASAGREIAAARGTDTAALFVVPSPDEITALPGAPRRAARRRRSEAGGMAEPAFAGGPATPTGTGSADGSSGGPVEAHRSADPTGAGPADVAPDTDPFHGPLRVPLLAPLLDPTASGADEPDYRPPDPTPIRPVPALPVTGRTQEAAPEVESVEATSRTGRVEARRARSAEPADPPSDAGSGSVEPTGIEPDVPAGGRRRHADDQPSGTTAPVTAVVAAGAPGASASAPDAPESVGSDDVPQEWEDDWRSGEWAMPPAVPPPLPPADRAEPAEAFDVFGTATSRGAVENAAERTGRTPLPPRAAPELPGSPLPHRAPPERHAVGSPGSGQLDEARPKPDLLGADTGRTLAQPPAGRRDRTVAETGPHRTGHTGTPADGSLFDSPTARVSSPSRPPGPPRRPIPPSTAGDPRRPVPLDLPPASSDDVSLFGESPAPTRGVPEGPAPNLPRTGRRRRPDADEPETPPPPATDVESSLFNSTERDLLAQLQEELAARERRPRPYRRARTDADPAVNGHGVNGHGADEHGVNGHGVDGPGPNGHGPNGYGTNGHDTNGHDTNGHGNGPPGDRPPPDVSG
jgi:hypothetical protein